MFLLLSCLSRLVVKFPRKIFRLMRGAHFYVGCSFLMCVSLWPPVGWTDGFMHNDRAGDTRLIT
jgi:hypothetical protein